MQVYETRLRYNSINSYLRERFGRKVVKLSLDAGFTCPNRDGLCGTGGCIFCSDMGSGDLSGRGSISAAMESQLALLSKKWPSAAHLAYFQSHTNTYAPVSLLRKYYYEALEFRYGPNGQSADIVGLAIATRPDCLSEEVLDLLSELNKRTFLWVELGLQTIHEETAKTINRGYDLSVFDDAMEQLKKRGIRTVVHLLFGLPKRVQQDSELQVKRGAELPSHDIMPRLVREGSGSSVTIGITRETRDEMLASLGYVCEKRPFGIKFHMLNVVKNSPLAQLAPGYTPFESPEEYINLACDMIERTPSEVTIHRLYGDVPRKILLAPDWAYKKRSVLNGIEKELQRRNSYQGKALEA